MMRSLKIDIDELQEITNYLLSKMREQRGKEIELEGDFYWDISGDELYNPYDSPTDISLGQLSHDLEEISRLSGKKEEAIPYDLKRVAEILRALSLENPVAF